MNIKIYLSDIRRFSPSFFLHSLQNVDTKLKISYVTGNYDQKYHKRLPLILHAMLQEWLKCSSQVSLNSDRNEKRLPAHKLTSYMLGPCCFSLDCLISLILSIRGHTRPRRESGHPFQIRDFKSSGTLFVSCQCWTMRHHFFSLICFFSSDFLSSGSMGIGFSLEFCNWWVMTKINAITSINSTSTAENTYVNIAFV